MQLIKRTFAEEITTRVHGETEFAAVQAVSQLLFNPKAAPETLRSLDARTLSQVAGEIPAPEVSINVVQNHCNILDFLSEHTGILSSRSEAKKAIQNNAISINKEKITDLDVSISPANLLHGRYLMVENGKKNKFLVQVV